MQATSRVSTVGTSGPGSSLSGASHADAPPQSLGRGSCPAQSACGLLRLPVALLLRHPPLERSSWKAQVP
jgi:hypothetical protein